MSDLYYSEMQDAQSKTHTVHLKTTSEDHIMPMREIITKMNTLYGIKPDRRTICSAASLLIDLGYDISVFEDNGVG